MLAARDLHVCRERKYDQLCNQAATVNTSLPDFDMVGFCKTLTAALFEYDTSKVVHIQSKTIGIINRLIQLTIICYIIM